MLDQKKCYNFFRMSIYVIHLTNYILKLIVLIVDTPRVATTAIRLTTENRYIIGYGKCVKGYIY